ncbi:hypothetical protein [Nocardioides sp. zg-1228]|uniref:hypothetical protein n=1 Tax=Nocardioides sp. zg-1228 TaxID=2763008 RepID=UPI001642EC58|nr:hypothetical protein [Nocardioides sp. zg-1228]MBC2933047.1 hypothetical protein [Nocardioides sp. zg-1228]QSF56759.1 hypothetical protein JX575_14275 [Nocardioides sp. zg-1228]
MVHAWFESITGGRVCRHVDRGDSAESRGLADAVPLDDGLTVGARALRALLLPQVWIHRRVESLAFQPTGETRRRISWDLTPPQEWAIAITGERVALPLTTLHKRPIKRLDVTGPADESLVVWETERNGNLAAELMLAGLSTLGGAPASARVRELVRTIVFAESAEHVQAELDELLASDAFNHDADPNAADEAEAVAALAKSLAEGFLLVVEIPRAWVGERTVVKVSYDDDRVSTSSERIDPWVGRTTLIVDARGSAGAASWHLELHAPANLTISRLRAAIWDSASEQVVRESEAAPSDSTSHINGRFEHLWWQAQAQVRFAPTTAGLLNQVTLGVLLGIALLVGASFAAAPLSDRLSQDGGSGTLAGLVFSFPALFMALLARSSEHQLVSRVLMAPRLASFCSAVSLWCAGVLVAWNPNEDVLSTGLGALATVQAAILFWLGLMRPVGGES